MAKVLFVEGVLVSQGGVWCFHFKVNVDEEDSEVTQVDEVLNDGNTDLKVSFLRWFQEIFPANHLNLD